MSNYWQKVTRSRLSRRRVMAVTGGSVAAAAFLAACGSGSDEDNTQTPGAGTGTSTGTGSGEQSGLVSPQVDRIGDAKPGGTLRTPAQTDIRSHQPYLRDTSVNYHTWLVYSFLVRTQPSAFHLGPPDQVIPDGAQSWEYSPDKLTLTFKLQPEAKWDQRPPTNGRPVVAEDVVTSWHRLEATSSIRNELANSVAPSGPIVSVTAPDDLTVVMNLAFPQAELLSQLRDYSAATLLLTPQEYDDPNFDSRSDSRGSGPYYRAEYTPSSSSVYLRNPNHWDKTAPYIERIERPIISEYSTALAQLKSGGIHYYGDGDTDQVSKEDIVTTKRDVPDLLMMPTDVTGLNRYFFYGMNPGSPWRDVRVRQAFMMSLDRELWIDTFFNVSNFERDGLPVDRKFNTCANCNWTGYWLDPEGPDFGEESKYYQHNIEEAKKLLDAAGYPDGFDTLVPMLASNQYGPSFPQEMEVIFGMAQEAGIRPTFEPKDYNTEWRNYTEPPSRDLLGKFDGVTAQLASTSSRIWLWALLNSKGSFFRGFDAEGTGSGAGDPVLDEMTSDLLQEFDQDEAYRLAHEIQRHEARMAYASMFPGGASGFRLGWPAVGNFGVYRQDRWFKTVFIDETQPPGGR